jgi:hypothetical protein
MSDPSVVVLSLPGPWADTEQLSAQLAASGGELRDGRFFWKAEPVGTAQLKAMSPEILEDLVTAAQGRMTEADRIALSRASSVAVLGLSCDSVPHARMAMAIGALVVSHGAVAVLVDPPHKAHQAQGWCELLQELQRGARVSLYNAYVRMFRTQSHYVTCGMGVLGLRDFIITREMAADEAFRILEHLAQWCIVETPALKPGSILGDGRGGYLVLQPEPGTHYEPDTDEYNPAGVWKLVPVAGP